jgi:hypothetical protein
MAKTVGSSAIINAIKQKAKGAWQESRKKEAKRGFISLPSGVRGVARLVGAVLRMSKENEYGTSPEVALKFIVREPIDHEGTQCFKSHYIAAKTGDYPKTINQVFDALSDDLQNCGVEQGENGLPDIEDWPEMLADLQTAKPYIHYHTWQPKDSEKVLFQIDGPVSDEIAKSFEDSPTELTDSQPAEVEEIVAAAEAGKPAPAKRKGPPPKKGPAPVAEDEPTPVEDEPTPVEEPVSKKGPEAGDRCYIVVKGEQLTCDITAVDDDKKTCVCLPDGGDKKYSITFEQLEKWNPDE